MGMNLLNKSSLTNIGIDLNKELFEVITTIEVYNNLVAKIKYNNCTNYEGIKICVFINMSTKELLNMKIIDPHFSAENNSPFARFKPTKAGWKAAINTACQFKENSSAI